MKLLLMRLYQLFNFKSLRFKILALGVCPVLLTLLSISALLMIKQFQDLRHNVEEKIHINTASAAQEIEESNLESATIPKIMAMAQENGLFGNREASARYATNVLHRYPWLTGVYFGYEPNADGQDIDPTASLPKEFANSLDENGRFIPYWHRNKTNTARIELEPLVDMETSLYYQGAKNRYNQENELLDIALSGYLSPAEKYLRERRGEVPAHDEVFSPSASSKALTGDRYMMITEPYDYEGKLIFEQTYPIVIDGKFVGIAGVDQALQDVQMLLEELTTSKSMGDSMGFVLISRRGRIIATTFDKYMTANTNIIESSRKDASEAASLSTADATKKTQKAKEAAAIAAKPGATETQKSEAQKAQKEAEEAKNKAARLAGNIDDITTANPIPFEKSRLANILKSFYEKKDAGSSIVEALDEKDGVAYFYNSAEIPTGDWTLVMRVSKNEVYAPLYSQLWTSGITFAIGGIFVSTVLFWLAHSIARRIAQAAKAAEQIAQGDLTGKIEAGGGDESGQLLFSITKMTGNLNALIGQVKQSSILLTSTATKISANAKTQESAVNEFGSSTTEIAAAVKEISATSQELSKTMNAVTENASETAHLADTGRDGLANMETAMNTLSEANSSISSKLAVISERAKNINQVVTTISKVADQTNLLSLNAAIEAEKAGEYGLGFSVVAREVRRLADQTAVATLDIDQMVKEMQSSVSAGVMEMDKFTEHMRQGNETVHNISSQLGAIIEHVQELTNQFETVRQGMNTQATGAQQINNAMGQLTDAAQSTSTSIVAFNQATSDLRDAVGGLREEVTKFKVNQN